MASLLRTDLPGPLEGDTPVKHYLCKTEADYVRLMGAIIGKPEIRYHEVYGDTIIRFPKPVYIEHIRILTSGEGQKELVSHGKHFQSSDSFIINTPGLQAGTSYLVEIQISGGEGKPYYPNSR